MNLFRSDPSAKPPKTLAISFGILNWLFIALLILGIVIVAFYGTSATGKATIFIWMFACLLSGAFIGFLFGIPKILQSPQRAADKKDGHIDADLTGYQQQVNTNLTEISDWLTKIIVGLGLVNLNKISGHLSGIAKVLAGGIDQSAANSGFAFAFAYGTIISYTCLGFLFGYITTRIYLATAFSMADQNALKRIAEKSDETAIKAEAALQKAEFALVPAPVPTNPNVQSAQDALHDLVQSYNETRRTMDPGGIRTNKMTQIIKGMMGVVSSIDNFDIVQALSSNDNGERLTGYAYLYVKPDVKYLQELTDAIIKDPTPFGQYWGIQSLGKIAALYPDAKLPADIYARLKTFHAQFERGIDREYELRKLLKLS